MADERIEIVISTEDRSSGPIQGIRGALGGIASVAGGILGAQVFTRVADGIASVGRQALSSIPAASNLNEALNASSVVFGDAAGVVQDFGRQAANSAGLSATAFNQMAAQTGAMLQNYGLSADEAATSTVDLAQRAADMASIFNTDVDDAMSAINAGLRGEGNSLERFGVSMNATTVEAQALAMGFEKVGGQFDAAALTQARMALLMQQTDNIAGDFTNTSDELANSTRINEARWANFMSKVGTLGLPIMETMQGILMDVGEKVFPIVEDAINSVMPVVEDIAGAMSTFVDALLKGEDPLDAINQLLKDIGLPPGVVDTLTGFADTLAGLFSPPAEGGLPDFLDRISGWFDEHGESLKATAQETFGKLAESFGTLVAGIKEFVDEQGAKLATWFEENGPLIESFVANIGKVVAFLGSVIAGVWPVIASILGGVIALILGIATVIMQVATGDWAGAWETIKETAAAVWEKLKEAFNNFANWVTGWFGSSWAEVKETWQTNWDMFKTIVSTVFDNIKTTINTKIEAIKTAIGDKIDSFRQLGSDLMEGLKGGILDKVQGIIDAVKGTVSDAIEAAKRLLGIGSPSKVFAEIGQNMMQGMAIGVEHNVRVPRLAVAEGTSQVITASAVAGGATGGGLTFVMPVTFAKPLLTTSDERELEDMLYGVAERLLRRLEGGG